MQTWKDRSLLKIRRLKISDNGHTLYLRLAILSDLSLHIQHFFSKYGNQHLLRCQAKLGMG